MQSTDQTIKIMNEILKEFDNVEEFLEPNQEKTSKFQNGLKVLYDFLKKTEDASDNISDSLPELIIESVDNEQIYQQLQLHNNSAFNSLMKYFAKCLAKSDEITFNVDMKGSKLNKKKKEELEYDDETTDDEEGDEEEEVDEIKETKKPVYGIPDGSDSEISDFDVEEGDEGEEEDEEEDNGQDDDDDNEEIDYFKADDEDIGGKSKKKKSSKKEDLNELDSDEIDEDLVEMYGDIGDEKEVLEIGKPAKEYKDEDFDELLEEEEEGKKPNNKKKVQFKDLFENNAENEKSDDELDENGEKKSSFEKRQEKFKEKVEKIHEGMMDNFENKPWQLKGEASAKARPEDSLLEEYLQFDHTTRQAPVITSEITTKLEDIIKQRIKDKAFDDVERKIKPVEMNYEFKKQITLDQEKSKMSLSQVYEQDYLNKAAEAGKTTGIDVDVVEKVNPKHEEIRKGLESLFIKLDALSNFHYTPKAPQHELKVVSNMPTISVEEVAPVNVSDANLLAPEEIHKKIDALPMSKEEESKKDKKRKLRVKKIVAKKTKVEKEKKLKLREAANPDDQKLKKDLAMEKLKKESKNVSNNLKILKKDKKSKVDGSLTNSSAFFKELNEVGKAKKHRKKSEDKKSSKKLKL